MNKDKKVLYILSGILVGAFLLFCFVPKQDYSNLWIAASTAILAIIFGLFV